MEERRDGQKAKKRWQIPDERLSPNLLPDVELDVRFQGGAWIVGLPDQRGPPAKSVIVQFATGDQTNPNAATTAILRAGRLADVATFYRHVLASYRESPAAENPHGFLVSIGTAAFRDISLGALSQIAVFFASDGKRIIHPDPVRLFEVPIVLPLPEDLNFIP